MKINNFREQIRHLYGLFGQFFIRYFTWKKFFNLLYNLYEYKTRKIIIKSVPFKAHFDVANACVLNCALCPTGQHDCSQTKRAVKLEEFKPIFDKFKDYLFFVRLYNWGEPLLNAEFFDIVDYCHANNVGVQIDSNLNYYNEAILKNLVTHKVDYLSLSIDGFTQENYEFYRGNGNLAKVFAGMEKIVAYKKEFQSARPLIRWQFLINNKNRQEVEAAYDYAKKLGIESFDARPMALFTTIDSVYSQANYQKFLSDICSEEQCQRNLDKNHCNFLWTGLSINPDLSFSPCTATYRDSDNFGSFIGRADEELFTILNSQIFQESRKIFKLKNYQSAVQTPCARCSAHTKP